jgi:hypothetical protein
MCWVDCAFDMCYNGWSSSLEKFWHVQTPYINILRFKVSRMPSQLLVLKCCFLNAKKLWTNQIMISFLYLPMLNISYQAFEN